MPDADDLTDAYIRMYVDFLHRIGCNCDVSITIVAAPLGHEADILHENRCRLWQRMHAERN